MGKILIIKGADFSQVAVDTVIISGLPPVITITATGSVTISAIDAVSIHYTIDGSTPSESSTIYTSAFTVSEGTTVKAIAVYANDLISEVSSKTYKKEYMFSYNEWESIKNTSDINEAVGNLTNKSWGVPLTEAKEIRGAAYIVGAGGTTGGTLKIYKVSPAQVGGTQSLIKTVSLSSYSAKETIDVLFDEPVSCLINDAIVFAVEGGGVAYKRTDDTYGFAMFTHNGNFVINDVTPTATNWIPFNVYW